jgi:hypothetical protein
MIMAYAVNACYRLARDHVKIHSEAAKYVAIEGKWQTMKRYLPMRTRW